MNGTPTLLWFRQDLRIRDNPALLAACGAGGPVIPVFIRAVEEEGRWAPGGASRWWLHHSLRDLGASLERLGSRLQFRTGPSLDALRDLVARTGARAVFWNRRYEPDAVARDAAVEKALRDDGLEVRTFNAALLYEPWEVLNKTGDPYRVFTPFWKACLAGAPPPDPANPPSRLPAPSRWPDALPLERLKIEPRLGWTKGLQAAWRPGEAGALRRMKEFLDGPLAGYQAGRDLPGEPGTSRLSPHLHFGEIGPRQIRHALESLPRRSRTSNAAALAYDRQVGWREFAHHLLFHFPHTTERPLRPEFALLPWATEGPELDAWQRGRTGYPIVDAGMRELWATGWMHNRVRMITASFLVKDLLLPWQAGAAWFWDTLVDADLANNTLGWQWTAGCGADAAPFFRIFNPVLQGVKFDTAGAYVRRWVPELARLPDRWIHRPWEAPPGVLAEAGVTPGRSYPPPLVDHAARRLRALAAYERVTKRRKEPR